ncbi:MAG: DNA-binding protein [Clostridia bacterium]|nr:DNA-binding protein [Clostridia bacterium]MBQ8269108.1 DNA-binding protein [Clostridia bacterium]MBR2325363.1 DNA-binding protein [Clostridia bacterium]
MFEKNMKISYLLDFYGDVLDERVRAVMGAYYDNDLSLAEIAEGEGISRQGVRHLIKKGEEHLLFLEEKLGLAATYGEIRAAAESLTAVAEEIRQEKLCRVDAAEKIDAIANLIVSKGV